jgi:hypothetical protein
MPGLIYGIATRFYNGLGLYFLGRVLLRQGKDFKQLIVWLAGICSVLAGFMLTERVTHRNMLTWLGAYNSEVVARKGTLRCQATFAHPVLAGTYGTVLIPLFIACWWQPRMRRLVVAGCLASIIMAVTAGSAGPVMTLGAVLSALVLWPLRRRMRACRWTILLTLLGLHLVMKAPVWALIGRIRIAHGTSYHRFALLDSFIEHFRDWWLMGIQDTESWGYLMDDVANNFCIVGKHGGLLGVALFIWVLVVAFREVGLRRREAESDRPTGIMVWAFGASLFGHIVSFFGTSYFDQTNVLWQFTLAMIGSLSLLTQGHRKPAEAAAAHAVAAPVAMIEEHLIEKPAQGF